MSRPPCCPQAVYDSVAGWWCPQHGDLMLDDPIWGPPCDDGDQ